jgi:tRNA(Arg) A34 adenosine deaminase TadA
MYAKVWNYRKEKTDNLDHAEKIASRLIGCLLGQSEPARTLAPSLLD